MLKSLIPLVLLLLLAGCEQLAKATSPETKDTTPPSEVTNLVLTPGDGLVVLTWTDPGDPDFETVQVTANGTTRSAAKGGQTLSFTGLPNGTSLPFLVRTADKSGNLSTGVSRSATPATTSFTVSFDSQGGTLVTAQAGLLSGANLVAPTPPTKTGSAFAGWFTDTTFQTAWDFATDKVTSNKTLFARWGSASAVGVWFGLQSGVPASVDPSVDSIESVIAFRADGTYSLYQRRHAALSATYWANLDENVFYEVKAGLYYWNATNNVFVLSPRQVDVIRLSLLSASQTEAELTAADPSWTSRVGLKTLTQAQAQWGSAANWSLVSATFDKVSHTGATLGSDTFTDYLGTVTSLEYLAPGQTASSHEVWPNTYLDVTRDETRGGFRAPRSPGDFPAAVQGLLPTAPTAVKDGPIKAAYAAYSASPFFQGLSAAGTALSSAAQAAGIGGATSVNHSGTTGSVLWTNVESWTTNSGVNQFSGNQTYKPTGDQTLSGGITLLATSQGAVSYAGSSLVTSAGSPTFTKNLGIWTLRFSGSPVVTLEYTWDDVAKAVVGDVLINGTQSVAPKTLQ